MRPARFLLLDARMFVFVALFLLHVRMWTLGLLVVACIFFFVLEQKGLALPSAIRLARSFFAGRTRPAVESCERRAWISYAFETPDLGVFDPVERRAKPRPIALRPREGSKGRPADGETGAAPA